MDRDISRAARVHQKPNPSQDKVSQGVRQRGSGRSRTDDDGFAIRCLSHLATEPASDSIDGIGLRVESEGALFRKNLLKLTALAIGTANVA